MIRCEMYACTRNTLNGGLYNQKKDCGGEMLILCLPTKSPMAGIVIGRGQRLGICCLSPCVDEIPIMRNITGLTSKISSHVKSLESDTVRWFLNVSLHDPGHYGRKGNYRTCFVYGMAWGINNNILSAEEYLSIVIKAWNAMVTEAVHPNGFLGYVQGTGKEPKDGQPVTYDSVPDFEDYGVGCFLLWVLKV